MRYKPAAKDDNERYRERERDREREIERERKRKGMKKSPMCKVGVMETESEKLCTVMTKSTPGTGTERVTSVSEGKQSTLSPQPLLYFGHFYNLG